MRAGTGELFERIGEEELLATKVVDKQPHDEPCDGVNEADGGGFDVFIDVSGAGVKVDVFVKPEEIQEISEEHDGECGNERIAEGGLEHGYGHEDVVLAVVAIGGGSSEGKYDVDEDRGGGDVDESAV